jgi:hypothetical protein
VIVCLHADTLTALIEKHAMHQSPKRVDELVKIFIHATRVSFRWPAIGTETYADHS